MSNKKIALTLGIVCLLLSFAIRMQMKSVEKTNETVLQTFTENKLRDEVLKWKEKYDNAYASLERTEEQLENQRKKASQRDTDSLKMEEELKKINNLLGTTEVKGNGVIVVLNDNKTASLETIGALGDISQYLVHDGDIRQIVNELKNAGAEAVSINNQRIVQTTSIVCDGNVVRINGEKVGAPYTIKAIGFPEYLESSLTRPESYLKILIRDGVEVEVKKSENITIPKFNGVLANQYIKVVR